MPIGEVSLETNDVIRLADFYKELFHIENESDDPVHQYLFTEGTGLTVHNDGTMKENNNRNVALAFTVEDVDAEYERLLALNVKVLEPPETRPWGARNLHFQDPDGNHIYFRSLPKGTEKDA